MVYCLSLELYSPPMRQAARNLTDLTDKSPRWKKNVLRRTAVRRWYGFQHFTLKARSQSKMMQVLPLSVAQVSLTEHFSVCPHLGIGSDRSLADRRRTIL